MRCQNLKEKTWQHVQQKKRRTNHSKKKKDRKHDTLGFGKSKQVSNDPTEFKKYIPCCY